MPLGGGGRDYIPVCYVIDKEGSYYVPREGDQESRVSSSQLYSTVVNACHAKLTEGGEIFCKKNTYEVDELITLGGLTEPVRRLEFETGSIIKPKTDIDMFYVKENGQLINGYYDTHDILFSKSVVILGEGEDYGCDGPNNWIPENTLLRDLRGRGSFGAGKGNFVYVHCENDGICFINTKRIYTYGFTYPLYVHVDITEGYGFINGNRFDDWTMYNPVIGIYARLPEPPIALADLYANTFRGIQFEKGPDTTHGIKMDGSYNYLDGIMWDMGAAIVEFTKQSMHNEALLMVPRTNLKDFGLNNEITFIGQDRTKSWKFIDNMIGVLPLPCWNIVSGEFVPSGDGSFQLKTGALINDTAEIDWGGNKKVKSSNNPKFEFYYYPNRATDYIIIGRLKEDATNEIYIRIDTNLGTARFGCVEDGADTHIDFQPASYSGALRYWINVSTGAVTLFENFIYKGEITTNIPNGNMEPNFDIESLAAASLRMYLAEVKLIKP